VARRVLSLDPMSKLAGALLAISVIACGGTTDPSGEQTQGGGPTGGAGQAGGGAAGAAGEAGAAGRQMGGAGGSSAGAAGRAGSESGGASGGTGGSAGSGGLVDPRCPVKQPSAECGADDAGLTCRYDLATGCLCSPASSFGLCQYVDASCPTGTSPGRPGPPAEGGTGGVTTKIALPPQMKCVCSAEVWSCTYGL
jgi:hypothetical protein